MVKAKTRRGCAAFAKIAMSALVELGTHAPLRAVLGLDKSLSQNRVFSLTLILPPTAAALHGA